LNAIGLVILTDASYPPPRASVSVRPSVKTSAENEDEFKEKDTEK
jgi:hypothetical protein